MEPILSLESISKSFRSKKGIAVPAVRNVSLDVTPGETVGVVGESGSGKSTLSRIGLLLTSADEGRVLYEGEEVRMDRRGRQALRGGTQAIFQDPFDSLNPRFRVSTCIAEPLFSSKGSRAYVRKRVGEVAEQVGLSDTVLKAFPKQLSGGQRQRVSIARAIISRPKLIVLDEPTSALDVIVQAKILNLLLGLQEETHCGFLFVSHDISVVNRLAHRVAVMERGKLIEFGSAQKVLHNPDEGYTKKLISSVPKLPQ